jgi:DeoR/GlpR family transcriptional regulator of sugar metabolism
MPSLPSKADEGLWNSVGDVVSLQRAVVNVAGETIFCVDADKVGRTAPEFLVPLSEVQQLLTDASPTALFAAGVKLRKKTLLAA